MILTQTVTKHVFIPPNANFVEVIVWKQVKHKDEVSLVETYEYVGEKRLINLALVSELVPTTIQSVEYGLARISYDEWRNSRGVYGSFNEKTGMATLTNPKVIGKHKVLAVNKIHADVKLEAHYITFEKSAA